MKTILVISPTHILSRKLFEDNCEHIRPNVKVNTKEMSIQTNDSLIYYRGADYNLDWFRGRLFDKVINLDCCHGYLLDYLISHTRG